MSLFRWLRRLFRKEPAHPPTGLVACGAQATRGKVALKPTHLVAGDPQSPLIEIGPYHKTEADEYEAFSVPQHLATGLQGLFQLAPTLIATSAASGQYVLRFAPEVAQRLANGSASIVTSLQGGFLPIARGADGRFIGVGQLVPASPAAIALPLLAWQALAFITAQRYLADITARLARLEKGVQDIMIWLEAEQAAKLRADYEYLNTLAGRLRDCQFHEGEAFVIATQLEGVERDQLQVMHQLLLQRDKCIEEIEKQELTASAVNPGRTLDRCERELTEKISRLRQIHTKYLLAAQVRGMAAQLRCALSLNGDLTEDRLNIQARDLQNLKAELVRVRDDVIKRLPNLKSVYRSKAADNEAQGRVSKLLSEATCTVGEHTEDLERWGCQLVHKVREQQLELKSPLRLVATVGEQGQVVRMERLRARVTGESSRAEAVGSQAL